MELEKRWTEPEIFKG